MIHRPFLLAALLLLAACAHRSDPALPTCDGSARRPANLHGTVLTPTADRPAAPVAAPNTGGCA
ncbi:hypothetical protein MU852_03485 [Brevundimonas albigilva]|uniref:hypothetical protein n=1 Tax=Brevundimonas albigilva TaxID=1312364 RepID=UPI00201B4A00|nr:hypothetical protein [Brevundimonas albigilva]UQV18943.1 hypothetical protein MU852_03485 [Brevundimonas albigilva]